MMNKLGRPCSFGLVFILTGALALVGMNVLEAKKPSKPAEAQWQVAIPENGEWNLTGFSQSSDGYYAIFENQGSVEVVVTESRTGNTYFELRFAAGTSDYGVEIDGVQLQNHFIEPGEVPCCFPSPCDKYSPPDCMECALNNTYPTIAFDPSQTAYGFWLTVGTDEDIATGVVGGRLYLDILDFNDLSGDYHAMTCESPAKTVKIEKTDDNEWTITNGSYGGPTYLTCTEWYRVRVDENGKWLPPPKQYDQTVMTAVATDEFLFETIWTKN